MRIIAKPGAMRAVSGRWRARGCRVGLVPTMGALHEGHLSLVRASLAKCDRTVVSVFVNPIQFGPREDLRRYPRPFARDCAMLRRLGVDAVFHPSPSAVYPGGFSTSVEVTGPLVAGLCGPRRPGHFRGVATVVAKLFNIVGPDEAFFGAKDYQQSRVIDRMVRDLDMGTRVTVLPTVREGDGLAMSSRNAYLSTRDRVSAAVLYRALREGKAEIMRGTRSARAVLSRMHGVLGTEKRARVEYLSITDAGSLEPVTRLSGRVVMAMAVRLGGTRLIDNMVVAVPARGRPAKGKGNR